MVHGRDVLVARSVPAIGPTRHLALGEPGGMPQVGQPQDLVIDAVECGQRVDERLRHGAPGGGIIGKLLGPLTPDDGAHAPLHHEERLAHHLLVGTEVVRLRGQGIGGVQHREHPVLPGHVVAARGDGPQRRAAQRVFPRSHPGDVREVGLATGELLELDRGVTQFGERRPQMGSHPFLVEAFF